MSQGFSRRFGTGRPTSAWIIHYKDGDGEEHRTHASGLDGVEPSGQPGDETDSLRFVFRSDRAHTGRDDPLWDQHRMHERYRQTHEVCSSAGEYEAFYANGRLYYTETQPGRMHSPVIGIEPDYNTPTTAGLWIALDDFEGDTRLADTVCILELEGHVVAQFEEYGPNDREKLENDLSYGGL